VVLATLDEQTTCTKSLINDALVCELASVIVRVIFSSWFNIADCIGWNAAVFADKLHLQLYSLDILNLFVRPLTRYLQRCYVICNFILNIAQILIKVTTVIFMNRSYVTVIELYWIFMWSWLVMTILNESQSVLRSNGIWNLLQLKWWSLFSWNRRPCSAKHLEHA